MMYYDITDLINHSRFTHKVSGIQRVVLEGLKGTLEDAIPFFISPLTGKTYICKNFKDVDLSDLKVFENIWVECELLKLSSNENIVNYFNKYLEKKPKYFKLRNFFKLLFQIPIINTLIYLILKLYIKKKFSFLKTGLNYEEIDYFPNNSSIAMFGGLWNFQKEYEILLSKLDSSIKKIVLVYDMIPIYSYFVPDELKIMFERYIPFVLNNFSHVIVNANSTKLDIEKYIEENNLPTPHIYVIHLAHILNDNKLSISTVKLRTRKLFVEKYILCVGSIESRKNHINLLNMWYRYVNSDSYSNEKLVIAGRWLWDAEIIQQFLTYTGHVFGSVIIIENPDDNELTALYKNCKYTVYPSHYEGWGLPLGESLGFRKPCIHFDNSSLKEAGYNLTISIDYLNYDEFYKEMIKLLKDENYYTEIVNNINKNYAKLRNWNSFSTEIKSLLSKLD